MHVLNQFRKVALAEGVSYLVLLLIAMPLKYFANLPEAVLYFGWVHGALFIWYMVLLAILYFGKTWNFKTAFLAGLVSLIPFGTFWFDKKYLQ